MEDQKRIRLVSWGILLLLGLIWGSSFILIKKGLEGFTTQLTTALFASMVTYIIPIVAIGWGWADGEPISVLHIAGLLLILAGVYMAGRRRARATQSANPADL